MQHAFQAETKFGGLNFLAVFSADSGNKIGINQGAFQEIHVSEEFHLRNREQVPRKHQKRQRVSGKQALIPHIVDRENA